MKLFRTATNKPHLSYLKRTRAFKRALALFVYLTVNSRPVK